MAQFLYGTFSIHFQFSNSCVGGTLLLTKLVVQASQHITPVLIPGDMVAELHSSDSELNLWQ